MKFDLLKKTRSPKPEREVTLLITVLLKHQFYACGTVASVKGTSKGIERRYKPDIIREHLSFIFTPTEILEKAGGLHKFMNWDVIFDGFWWYQVYSRQTENQGRVKFKSHIDGSFHFFHTRECDGNSTYHRC
jgi:queuine tRNA-ribosyltransferase